MTSNEDLLAKLEEWEASRPSPPTLFDALKSDDIELFAAFLLRGYRQAAKEAVADRLKIEELKLVGVDHDRPGAAGRVADGLARIWALDELKQLQLLGLSDPNEMSRLRKEPPEALHHEVLERLAMLLDIFQALRTLLPQADAADTWIKRPNEAPLLGGRTALDLMVEGGLASIRDVRAYLWAQVWSV